MDPIEQRYNMLSLKFKKYCVAGYGKGAIIKNRNLMGGYCNNPNER